MEVRQGIAAAVGEWGGTAASPWLRERLAEDPAPSVRAEAAYRLGLLSDLNIEDRAGKGDRKGYR